MQLFDAIFIPFSNYFVSTVLPNFTFQLIRWCAIRYSRHAQTDPNISPHRREMPTNFPPSNLPTLFRGNSITRRIPRPMRQSVEARGEIPARRCRNRFPRERNASSRRLARLRSSSRLPSPAARTRKRYLSYRRNNNGATRAEVYGKLNICSRRKKVIVSEYIFRWRRGTHSWRDALRDLINSRSCIRTEIRIYMYVYVYKKVESLDSRRILRDATWIKNKEGERVKAKWMGVDFIEFLLLWSDLRFK